MALHLFIEDTTGKPTFLALARRITTRPLGRTIAFKGYGQLLKYKDVESQLKMCHLATGDKVVAVVDKDCDATRFQKSKEIQEQVARVFPKLDFQFVVAIEELESWLASDTNALKTVLGNQRLNERLPGAECHEPKDFLGKLFTKYKNRDYVASADNVELANAIDLDTVATINPSFVQFRDALSK